MIYLFVMIVRRFLATAIGFAALLLVAACGGRPSAPAVVTDPDGFPMIVPPESVQGEEFRTEFLAVHFWDAFFEREVSLPEPNLEEKFSLWTMLLASSSEKTVSAAADRWLKKMPESSISKMAALAEKYLYNHSSPLRNGEVFAVVGQKLSLLPSLDSLQRVIYANEARLCSLNKVGTKAGDFSFVTMAGAENNLYSIKAPLILLVFSNPGCHMCEEIQQAIAVSPNLTNMQKDGSLVIVNIYPDEDEVAWRKVAKGYPKEWVSGIDREQAIRNKQIYDLWAIPSLYLLSSNKTVILKDAPLQEVLSKIEFIHPSQN